MKQGEISVVDGQMLTETLHGLGINVRYIGRLAAMAKADLANPSNSSTSTTTTSTDPAADPAAATGPGSAAALEKRFRCPQHLVPLCEAEMAARAAKHVVFDLLKDRGDLRAAPGPTVVAVLNAVLGGCGGAAPSSTAATTAAAASTDGATSPEPGATGGGGGKKKGKKGGKGNGHPGQAASAALPAHATPAPPPLAAAPKTPGEIKALILEDIKLRFRYASPTLLVHHATPAAQALRQGKAPPGEGPTAVAMAAPGSGYWSVANPNALLRRLCQKLGLRVVARAYDWASPEPVSLGDIVDIQPVAKSTATPAQHACEPARELLDAARVFARQGMLTHAFEYAQEAGALYRQVGLGGFGFEWLWGLGCWGLGVVGCLSGFSAFHLRVDVSPHPIYTQPKPTKPGAGPHDDGARAVPGAERDHHLPGGRPRDGARRDGAGPGHLLAGA